MDALDLLFFVFLLQTSNTKQKISFFIKDIHFQKNIHYFSPILLPLAPCNRQKAARKKKFYIKTLPDYL